MSILNWQVAGAPWAIVDVETTGLNPGHDRVIEVSVVHLDQEEPKLVFDTLVFPDRAVDLTVHGLTSRELEDAPRFFDIAALLLEAIAGRVMVAHNAEFDLRFLSLEFHHVQVGQFRPPYLCTMALHRALEVEPAEKSLRRICSGLGVPLEAHTASGDALALGRLMQHYRMLMKRRGLRNFHHLKSLMNATCCGSWEVLPIPGPPPHLPRGCSLKSRCQLDQLEKEEPKVDYSCAVLQAVSDYELSEAEYRYLMVLREEQCLTDEQIRAAHSAVLTWFLSQAAADGWVDSVESERLRKVHDILAHLGWAPGASLDQFAFSSSSSNRP